MTNTMKPVLAGALLAMVSFGIAGTASAAPVGNQTAAQPTSDMIQLVRHNNDDGMRNRDRDRDRMGQRRYSHRHHGRRCSKWNNHCRHYYRGYYYETPWWTLPLIIGGAVASSHSHGHGYSRHVEWCEDRYRSYNPRYNTWVSYSGHVHQCVSPYS